MKNMPLGKGFSMYHPQYKYFFPSLNLLLCTWPKNRIGHNCGHSHNHSQDFRNNNNPQILVIN